MDQASENQLSLFNRHSTNYQSNIFTLSRQEFTELEKKIVILVVNQLGNLAVQGKLQPNRNQAFLIPYSELTKDHYAQVSAAAESLSKKQIAYKDEKKGDYLFITPFPMIRSVMQNNRRYIEIDVYANVVPYFADLGQRYTKYELDIIWSLSSVYAIRIFEIVSMHQHIKKTRFTFPVDEMLYILNCPSSYRYADFQVNVLEVAKRELRNKAQLIFEWSPSKKIGKKVVELEFQLKTVQELGAESVVDDQMRIAQLSASERVILGYQIMAKYQLKSWQKDYIITEPGLLDTLFRLHSEFENQRRPDVKNKNKYLAKSLGLDKLKEPKKTSPAIVTAQLNFTQPITDKRIKEDRPIGSIISSMISQQEK
jgi:plasmid replication initiation protein